MYAKKKVVPMKKRKLRANPGKNDSSSKRNIVSYLATLFTANFELILILIKPEL